MQKKSRRDTSRVSIDYFMNIRHRYINCLLYNEKWGNSAEKNRVSMDIFNNKEHDSPFFMDKKPQL